PEKAEGSARSDPPDAAARRPSRTDARPGPFPAPGILSRGPRAPRRVPAGARSPALRPPAPLGAGSAPRVVARGRGDHAPRIRERRPLLPRLARAAGDGAGDRGFRVRATPRNITAEI